MENILVELPPSPGVYALHLTLAQQKQLQVGYLGDKLFPSGEYIYLGSAQGPGGLRARLHRHLSNNRSKRLHWHIDYLRQVSIIHSIHFILWQDKESLMIPLECAWSQLLINSPQASVPVKHFGSSDCRSGCPAHLVAFPLIQDHNIALSIDNLDQYLAEPSNPLLSKQVYRCF